MIAHQAGRNDIAVELIARAIRQDPSRPAYYCNLGEAHRVAGQLEQAVAAFRAAIQLSPDFAAAHYNLGNALKAIAQFDAAIDEYRQAAALRPDFAPAWNNLGNLLSRVATVVGKKCDGIGPPPQDGSPLQTLAADVYDATADAWDRVAPHEALEATWRLIHETNAYLENNEPWKADPGAAVDAVMGDALEALRIVSVLAWPAMPSTTTEIWRRIGLSTSYSALSSISRCRRSKLPEACS